jgi:hypothetical protein
MRRILVSVGCDQYDQLAELQGAEQDARAMHDQLVGTSGDYDAGTSRLLLSPTVDAIVSTLSGLPFGTGEIQTLTFFFAGHGGDKSGTYYLCARDTDPNRLSITGLGLNRLLSVITELRPLQANVIIDACQSGSAMLDSAVLLRADALGLGDPGSLSIAFLAACGPREYATETARGGALTQNVLTYLTGEATLQTTRPALDLIDLGRRVSADLSQSHPDQLPITWGINLTGEGRFAPNPHFAPSTEDLAKAAAVLSASTVAEERRAALDSHSFELWRLHREVQEELDVASLRQTLRSVLADLDEDNTATAAMLRGLATSLRASAVTSIDVFAESLVLFACAEPLLHRLNDDVTAALAKQLLDEAVMAQARARTWLLTELARDRFCLLSDGNGIADLYFLPTRLSRILGWLAVGLEVHRLLGQSDQRAERETQSIAVRLIEDYSTSLVPRSDAQAPFLLAFVAAARHRGWTDIVEQMMGCYFDGFLEASGVLARPDLADDDAFIFSLTLGAGSEHVEYRFRANPTQFLSVLLMCGAALAMDDDWDAELARLDHHAGYLFVPKAYADFSKSVIEDGNNFTFAIGRDVFTLADFRAVLQRVGTAVESARKGLSPVASAIALVAACLQPDKLPLHIVEPAAT